MARAIAACRSSSSRRCSSASRTTRRASPRFAHNRLPPLRELARLAARARLAMAQPDAMEEIAFELTGAALRLAGRRARGLGASTITAA